MGYRAGSVIGDYLVLEAVASGGMGTVYKVQHAITRRVEAIKLLASSHTDPEREQRFMREMQVQARLLHPNIASVYNAFRCYNEFFLVLEFIDGESLQSLLARGRLPLATGMNYTRQALSALGYAHAHGVVHRDISPSNMIVTPDDTVKLTDFGLARTDTDVRLTPSGAPLGSPWYMSPEQVQGETAIDARSDIYSIGVLLYEIATGSKPFDFASSFDVMRAHLEVAPVAPIEIAPGLSPMLNHIILTAMAKDPAGRFQSAEQFQAALESCHADCVPATCLSLGQPTSPTNTDPLTIAATSSSRSVQAHPLRHRQSTLTGVVQTAITVAASALLLLGSYISYMTAKRRPPVQISSSQPVQEVSALPPPLVQPTTVSPKPTRKRNPGPVIASARPISRPIPADVAPRPRSITGTNQGNRSAITTSSEDAPKNKREGNRFLRALHRMIPFHKQENT